MSLPIHLITLIALIGATAPIVQAQQSNAGQPTKTGKDGTFEIVGHAGVSAQQLFLGTSNKVYIIDKTEANPPQVTSASGNVHPAWATEYDLTTNQFRPMDVVTNSFCAGGNVLGNGMWMNVGGNQAIGPNGVAIDNAGQKTGEEPYWDADGGFSVRFISPCDDGSCEWVDDSKNYISTRRWYPTLETLPDGRMLIMGGNQVGGYVSDPKNNNPTYEIYDPNVPGGGGQLVDFALLNNTLPANLFPFAWLLPSGNMIVQSNWKTSILDFINKNEYPLDDIPHAVRTYPASAATVMFPLTPANNWTATMMFCGGSDLQPDQWVQANNSNAASNLVAYPASDSCVTITPDVENKWVDVDPLPVGRVMASAVLLPDGKILVVNGANTGTAGYGFDSWVVGGQSYADHPVLTPLLYDPEAPAGSRWTTAGEDSSVNRMYHSSATLLPDGSVFVSGSNPNADYIAPNTPNTYWTEDRVERFYPSYYSNRRPEPTGLPTTLTYGGAFFDIGLSKDDLGGDVNNAANAKVVVIRTGFSTHALSMGQRFLQLNNTYTASADGSAVLHVSQLPPNPNIFAPGPALLFVVVNDTPSVGVWVMLGSGKVETQPLVAIAPLPSSSGASPAAADAPPDSKGANSGDGKKSGSLALRVPWLGEVGALLAGVFIMRAFW